MYTDDPTFNAGLYFTAAARDGFQFEFREGVIDLE
jgi:hypothetical protein